MVLTGDRKPLENGVLGELLRGQEILISGRVPDWALNSAAMDLLNKAAYLTGDGRWIAYRERTGVDTDVFRLGQSFWPDETLAAQVADRPGGQVEHSPLAEAGLGARAAAACPSTSRSTSAAIAARRMRAATTSCWTASTAPRAIPTTRSTSWNCGWPAGRSCKATTTRC